MRACAVRRPWVLGRFLGNPKYPPAMVAPFGADVEAWCDAQGDAQCHLVVDARVHGAEHLRSVTNACASWRPRGWFACGGVCFGSRHYVQAPVLCNSMADCASHMHSIHMGRGVVIRVHHRPLGVLIEGAHGM